MAQKANVRQSEIINQLKVQKFLSIEDLAVKLDVSSQTIRRDINALAEANLLRRHHGGAALLTQPQNDAYPVRQVMNLQAKQSIAAEAATLIEDGMTLFISIGSTPALVAKELVQYKDLTIITNNLNAAMELSAESSNRIMLPSGELRLPDRDLIGHDAMTIFAKFRADFAIFGVGGIDLDGTLLDYEPPEVLVREIMRENSRQSILVCDDSKFGRKAPAVGGHINEADHVIINAQPDDETFVTLLANLNDRLRIAGE